MVLIYLPSLNETVTLRTSAAVLSEALEKSLPPSNLISPAKSSTVDSIMALREENDGKSVVPGIFSESCKLKSIVILSWGVLAIAE